MSVVLLDKKFFTSNVCHSTVSTRYAFAGREQGQKEVNRSAILHSLLRFVVKLTIVFAMSA